jgi:hypothetical protein
MEGIDKEFEKLLDKYENKIKVLTDNRNKSYKIRHEIYSENSDWSNSPNEKAEIEKRGKYEDDLNDKIKDLRILLDNIYDAMEKLNDGIDECKDVPFDRKE